MATEFNFNSSPFSFSNNFQPSNPFLGEVPVLEQSDFSSSFEPSFPTFSSFNEPMNAARDFDFDKKVLDFAGGITDLLKNFKTDQGSNQQPIISSVNEPGLEPFNRFNPTTQQFEQLFGNPAARMGSQDQFVEGETGFNDEQRFLQNIGIQGDGVTGVAGFDEFGMGSEPRTAAELNQLLGMQQIQANQDFVNSPYFQEAMDEMNAPFIESGRAFDNASFLREARLDDRIPFNATFNYDDAGNKVLAGESARAAAEAQGGRAEMSFAEASKFVPRTRDYRGKLEPASTYNRRVEAYRAEQNARIQASNEVVSSTQQFLSQYGMNVEPSVIRSGIQATGSPQAFIRSYSELQRTLTPSQLSDYKASLAESETATHKGMPIESQGTFVSKKDGSTRVLGFSQDTGVLGEVTPLGEWKPVDMNDWRELSTTEIGTSRENALKSLDNAFDSFGGIAQMEQFVKDRIESPQGFKQFVVNMQTNFKNYFDKELTREEFMNSIASAGFEALLGVIRLDVLGPGVLTEQDALRLVKAMGGFGGTSSKKVSIELVNRLIDRRKKKVEGQLSVYNIRRDGNDILRNSLPLVNMNNISDARRGVFENQAAPANSNTGRPPLNPDKIF